ncbi:MAG: acyl carrier protein [Deltaproteobacteria bacterium]|jgi:acyl carrier protein|nr:acyl carrier protein [Deltaproteobacteria bacterium]|tara:strand:- start:1170 stop:1412 length:243 start_codon:yes stop_codon:yes gene_type:complete
MSSITEKINSILVEDFELPADTLTEDATLRDDLGLDSLDAIDLASKLEEQSGIVIETQVLAELNTLGDMYALVEELVAKG